MNSQKRWLKNYQLKSLSRSGWLRKGIETPESVAAHSWGLALLCMEFAPRVEPTLDVNKTLQLALVHDLPEVIVGDITPHDSISKQEKQQQEQHAAQHLLSDQMHELWNHYRSVINPMTGDAMDKIDMALQALVYAPQTNTSEFLASAKQKIPPDLNWIWYELDLP